MIDNVLIAIFLIIICISNLLIGSCLYMRFGFGKKFFHDILGWHVPGKNNDRHFDGASVHSNCKYCDKDIMQDSQGNWF